MMKNSQPDPLLKSNQMTKRLMFSSWILSLYFIHSFRKKFYRYLPIQNERFKQIYIRGLYWPREEGFTEPNNFYRLSCQTRRSISHQKGDILVVMSSMNIGISLSCRMVIFWSYISNAYQKFTQTNVPNC